MSPQQPVESPPAACIIKRIAFAARHDVPVRLLDPAGPCFGETLGDLFSTQPLPVAEEYLAQQGLRVRRNADCRADHLRGLERTLQVTRIEPDERATRKPSGDHIGLTAAFVRKRRVELALDPAVASPCRLAMTNENKPSRSWTLGDWKLRRPRARASGLHASTHLLFISD